MQFSLDFCRLIVDNSARSSRYRDIEYYIITFRRFIMKSFAKISCLILTITGGLIVAGCQNPDNIRPVDDPSAQHPYSAI